MNISKTLKRLGLILFWIGLGLTLIGVIGPVLALFSSNLAPVPGVPIGDLFPYIVVNAFALLFDSGSDPIERITAAGVLFIGLGISLFLVGIVTGVFQSKTPEAVAGTPAKTKEEVVPGGNAEATTPAEAPKTTT